MAKRGPKRPRSADAPDRVNQHAFDPRRSTEFVFGGYDWQPDTGQLRLHYALDALPLNEVFDFPISGRPTVPARQLEAAFDLLHWVAGISYWKAGCPQRVVFNGQDPDRYQAGWLNRLYTEGLAEFAHRQGLSASRFAVFRSIREPEPSAVSAGLERGLLVPMGGGKDSLVAWARLHRHGRVDATAQVGRSPLIAEVAARTGSRHWQIGRRIDPRLQQLNAAGAYNGHVPVTAINAAAMIVLALLHGYCGIAFANERSAEEPTRVNGQGQAVNHQFAKTLVFERLLDEWVRRYIASDLAVFSLLRRDRELAICQEFAKLESFHDVFSSCNRNFHLDGPRTKRWCGQCPKCHFVFLGLAPFMTPAKLRAIFGADLLTDVGQLEGFHALLDLDGNKPFECVGEAEEARAAVLALADNALWKDHAVVRALQSRLGGLEVTSLETLCRAGGDHLIPESLLDAA